MSSDEMELECQRTEHDALVTAAAQALEDAGILPPLCGTSDREIIRRTLIQLPVAALPTGPALKAVDALLQWELRQKACTDAAHLPRCRSDKRLAVWRGDITTLKIDGVVNAANEAGLGCFQPMHRCIDNVIHCAAGPALRKACDEELQKMNPSDSGESSSSSARLPTGQAMVTSAFNLPSKYVLHTPGPIGEKPELLAQCYRSVLDHCRQYGIRSVAFCCISTGLFGYPADRAAEVAVKTVRKWLDEDAARSVHPSLDLVVFNTFLQSDYMIYRGLLGEDAGGSE